MTLMKARILVLEKSLFKLGLLMPLLALLLAGCATNNMGDIDDQPPGGGTGNAAVLNKGDTITITFDGIPEPPPAADKTINDDGTISLADIGTITVAGKTTGEVERIITDKYVPSIYRHLTVTVKAGDRVYYVRGEIKAPGRQIYVGQITVTKAITSAGDFTDFSNKKKVLLVRSDGRRYNLNCDKILDGEAKDPQVYPGDQITVYRRSF
jgi:polysaccharide export outer membrane protein